MMVLLFNLALDSEFEFDVQLESLLLSSPYTL